MTCRFKPDELSLSLSGTSPHVANVTSASITVILYNLEDLRCEHLLVQTIASLLRAW